LTITPARAQAIDFSVGVIIDLVTLIRWQPEESESVFDFFAFVNVFPISAWLLISLGAFVVGLLTFAQNILKEQCPVACVSSIVAAMIFVYKTLLQLSSSFVEQAQCASARLMIVAVSIPFYLLYCMYTADLTAFMTATPKPPQINSFKDFLSNRNLQVLIFLCIVTCTTVL